MGKSSGSLKRKRSKNSSKAKASSRSKSRKHKSKKVRRREVSLSGSDYDDSKCVDTLVFSSSEDRHRSKRDRSRTRKDVKGRKKRARRRSCSCDSSEDSLHAQKRKKVKRKSEYDEKTRDKSYRKKKIKREASVSLMSSGSRSYSTCHGGSADNDVENKSSRGRLERKEKDKRTLRGRSGSEKSSRYRARSCSPCSSPCSESSYEGTEEKYMSENKSRRLRSVITVTKEAEESRELCENEIKEEIVDDHDYPCRSNDSNDGGTKRELDHHTPPLSEEKLRAEDETGDMNADRNFPEPKLRDTSYSGRSSLKAYNDGTSESMKKETSDASGANLNGDDLESILRQRALENLRKFRGVQSTAKASEQKNKIVSHVKQPITADKEELVQGKSNVSNAAVGTKFDKQTPVEEPSLPVVRRNLVAYPRNNERILNMDKDISGSPKHQLACAPKTVIDADNPSEVVTESTNNKTGKSELSTSESCHDSLQSGSTLKQMAVSRFAQEKTVIAESTKDKGSFEAAHVMSHNSNDNVKDIRGMPSAVPKPSIHGPKFKHNNLNKGQDDANDHSKFESKQTSDSGEPSDAKLSATEADNEERNAAKTTQSAIHSINSSGRDIVESGNAATSESGFKSSSVENNSGKSQDASNQGSQFEQKTMSVMRGGEMVQVSYKVYIPKKAPALARRQLKR